MAEKALLGLLSKKSRPNEKKHHRKISSSANRAPLTAPWSHAKPTIQTNDARERLLVSITNSIFAKLPHRSDSSSKALTSNDPAVQACIHAATTRIDFVLLCVLNELEWLLVAADSQKDLNGSILLVLDLTCKCLNAHSGSIDTATAKRLLALAQKASRVSNEDVYTVEELVTQSKPPAGGLPRISTNDGSSASIVTSGRSSNFDSSFTRRSANAAQPAESRVPPYVAAIYSYVSRSNFDVVTALFKSQLVNLTVEGVSESHLHLFHSLRLNYSSLMEFLQVIHQVPLSSIKKVNLTSICHLITTNVLSFVEHHFLQFSDLHARPKENPLLCALFDSIATISDLKKKHLTDYCSCLFVLLALCPKTLERLTNITSAKDPPNAKKQVFLEETIRKGLRSEKTAQSILVALAKFVKLACATPADSFLRFHSLSFASELQSSVEPIQSKSILSVLGHVELAASNLRCLFLLKPATFTDQFGDGFLSQNATGDAKLAVLKCVFHICEEVDSARFGVKPDILRYTFSDMISKLFLKEMTADRQSDSNDASPMKPHTDLHVATVRQDVLSRCIDIWTKYNWILPLDPTRCIRALIDYLYDGPALELSPAIVQCLTKVVIYACQQPNSPQSDNIFSCASEILKACCYNVLIDHNESMHQVRLADTFAGWIAFSAKLYDPTHDSFVNGESLEELLLSLEIVSMLSLADQSQIIASLALQTLGLLRALSTIPKLHSLSKNLIIGEIKTADTFCSVDTLVDRLKIIKDTKPAICIIFQEALRRWSLTCPPAISQAETLEQALPMANCALLFAFGAAYSRDETVTASQFRKHGFSGCLPPYMLQSQASKPQLVTKWLSSYTRLFAHPVISAQAAAELGQSLHSSLFPTFLKIVIDEVSDIYSQNIDVEVAQSFTTTVTRIVFLQIKKLTHSELQRSASDLAALLSVLPTLFPTTTELPSHVQFLSDFATIVSHCSDLPQIQKGTILAALRNWAIGNVKRADVCKSLLKAIAGIAPAATDSRAPQTCLSDRWICFFDWIFVYETEVASEACCRIMEFLPSLAADCLRPYLPHASSIAYLTALTLLGYRQANFMSSLLDSPANVSSELCTPDLSLALALCEVISSSDMDDVPEILLGCMETGGQAELFIDALLYREIMETDHEASMMRGNSVTSRILTLYGRLHSYQYCRYILKDLLSELIKIHKQLPALVNGQNHEHIVEQGVESLVESFLEAVTSRWQLVPSQIKFVCARIAELTALRFPQSSDLQAAGGYLFLRLINPVIVSPEAVDLELPTENNAQIRRSLVNISKSLQSLSNSIRRSVENDKISWAADQMSAFLEVITNKIVDPKCSKLDSWAETTKPSLLPSYDTAILQKCISRHKDQILSILETKSKSNFRLNERITVTASTLRSARKSFSSLILSLEDQSARTIIDDTLEAFIRRTGAASALNIVSDFDKVCYAAGQSRAGNHVLTVVLHHLPADGRDVESLLRYMVDRALSYCGKLDILLDATLYTTGSYANFTQLLHIITLLQQQIVIGAIYCLNPSASMALACSHYYKERTEPKMEFFMYEELDRWFTQESLMLCETTKSLVSEVRNSYTQIIRLHEYRSPVPVVIMLGHLSMVSKSLRRIDFGNAQTCQTIDFVMLSSLSDVRELFTSDLTAHVEVESAHHERMAFIDERSDKDPLFGLVKSRMMMSPEHCLPTYTVSSSRSTVAPPILAHCSLLLYSENIPKRKAAFRLGNTLSSNTYQVSTERDDLLSDLSAAYADQSLAVLTIIVSLVTQTNPEQLRCVRFWLRNLSLMYTVDDMFRYTRLLKVLTCPNHQQCVASMTVTAAFKIEHLSKATLESLSQSSFIQHPLFRSSADFEMTPSLIGKAMIRVRKLVIQLNLGISDPDVGLKQKIGELATWLSLITQDSSILPQFLPDLLFVCGSLVGQPYEELSNVADKIIDTLMVILRSPQPVVLSAYGTRTDLTQKLEGFCKSFLAAIADSDFDIRAFLAEDTKNSWRCRWISLVSSSAFQNNAFLQPRALLILSHLIDASVEDELLFQMLVALQTCFERVVTVQINADSIAAIFAAVATVIPNLDPNSIYILSLPWLAFTLLLSGLDSLFLPSVDLLHIASGHLLSRGHFSHGNYCALLLSARDAALSSSTTFDSLASAWNMPMMGLNLSWSIVVLTLRGLLSTERTTRQAVETLYKTLIAATNPPYNHPLSRHALPFVLSLLATGPLSFPERMQDCQLKPTGDLLADLQLDGDDVQTLAVPFLCSIFSACTDEHTKQNTLELLVKICKVNPQLATSFACVHNVSLAALSCSSSALSHLGLQLCDTLMGISADTEVLMSCCAGEEGLKQLGMSALGTCASPLEDSESARQLKLELSVTLFQQFLMG